MPTTNTYQILYLNGPSSVGKSTLARALQERLHEPFLFIGIDKLIGMVPTKLNDWTDDTQTAGFSFVPVTDQDGAVESYKMHIGPFGQRMVQALKDVTVTLAQLGHCVIVDDVSFGKDQVDAWRDALQDFNVLWVGVTAPLPIIEQR